MKAFLKFHQHNYHDDDLCKIGKVDEGVLQVLRLTTELLHGKSEDTIKNHRFASLRLAVAVLGSLAYLRNSSKIFGWFCSVLCELNQTV